MLSFKHSYELGAPPTAHYHTNRRQLSSSAADRHVGHNIGRIGRIGHAGARAATNKSKTNSINSRCVYVRVMTANVHVFDVANKMPTTIYKHILCSSNCMVYGVRL